MDALESAANAVNIGEPAYVRLSGVKNKQTGVAITGVVFVVQVKTLPSNGVAASNVGSPVNAADVVGTSGDYDAILPASVTSLLVAGVTYAVWWTATGHNKTTTFLAKYGGG